MHSLFEATERGSIIALRESSAMFHDGRIMPEAPVKGQNRSIGAVEEAGMTIREQPMVMKRPG